MTKNYNDLGVEFKYLIVNDMDQKYGLWVNTVGFQSIQHKGRFLRDYQLVYITKGMGGLLGDHAREASVQRTTDGAVSWSVAYILSLCADGLE